MGALTDLLVAARLELKASGGDAFDVLERLANGNGALVADALELLDGCTPHPLTFLLYAWGAQWTEDGDVGFWRTRPVEHVLAVMGKACVRAARMEATDASERRMLAAGGES